MGSHKKPLSVGKCTSEDLNVIFFSVYGERGGGGGGGGGGGSGGRRHVPSRRLDSKKVWVTYLLSIALPMTHG